VDGYGTHEIANELRISTFSIKRLENCVGQSVGSAELLAAVLDDEL
jgi:hypothetical protein